MTQRAMITGKVEYREGDGVNIAIRPGPVEIDESPLDVTIGWTDGESRGSASLPVADYRLYLSKRAIRLLDLPPQSH